MLLALHTKKLKPGLVTFYDVLCNGCDVVSYVYHLPVADDLIRAGMSPLPGGR